MPRSAISRPMPWDSSNCPTDRPHARQFVIVHVSLAINGEVCECDVPTGATLLDVLRDDLNLTGVRFGCGHGICGACYVLVDDVAHPACRLRVEDVSGTSITTIEGLARGSTLHPVQRAFIESDAMQCGYCTSGMIMSAVALLRAHKHPSEDEIRVALAPHLCRCGIYGRAVQAVQRATEMS